MYEILFHVLPTFCPDAPGLAASGRQDLFGLSDFWVDSISTSFFNLTWQPCLGRAIHLPTSVEKLLSLTKLWRREDSPQRFHKDHRVTRLLSRDFNAIWLVFHLSVDFCDGMQIAPSVLYITVWPNLHTLCRPCHFAFDWFTQEANSFIYIQRCSFQPGEIPERIAELGIFFNPCVVWTFRIFTVTCKQFEVDRLTLEL